MTDHRGRMVHLHRALDEARFGPDRTLNLRALRPTVKLAEERAEAWLRERQIARASEVLIVTGRGANSWDGVSVVRSAVEKLLYSLRRRGVVTDFTEHTAGSFVVRLAPFKALASAVRRRGEREPAPPSCPDQLQLLDRETREKLRDLARAALEDLGVERTRRALDSEMLRQFSRLAAGVPPGRDREQRLRRAIERALDEIE